MVTSIKGNDTSTFGSDIDVTGNVVTDAPAFSAYPSASTSVSDSVYTKVAFDTEELDSTSDYDSTTNYRFTPSVAGWYQINATVNIENMLYQSIIRLYKNGSWHSQGSRFYNSTDNSARGLQVSTLVYFNGTTDYVEIYVYQSSGSSKNASGTKAFSNFSGFLVRAV